MTRMAREVLGDCGVALSMLEAEKDGDGNILHRMDVQNFHRAQPDPQLLLATSHATARLSTDPLPVPLIELARRYASADQTGQRTAQPTGWTGAYL